MAIYVTGRNTDDSNFIHPTARLVYKGEMISCFITYVYWVSTGPVGDAESTERKDVSNPVHPSSAGTRALLPERPGIEGSFHC